MVFQIAQLHIVIRIDGFLAVNGGGVFAQRDIAFEVILKVSKNIVFIRYIKRLINFRIRKADETSCSIFHCENRLHRLAEPEAARVNRFYFLPRTKPELQGDQGCHIAAEAVHDFGPLFQGLDLVIPKATL